MEKELNELIELLLGFTDPLSLVQKHKSSDYLEELTKNYNQLPESSVKLVNRQIEDFTCDQCKQNIIAKEFSCNHRFCIICFDKLLDPFNCPCKQGKILANALTSDKCQKCSSSVKSSDINCKHYCENCIRMFYNKSVNSCFVCGQAFRVFVCTGRCSLCSKQPVDVFLGCQKHSHCQECAMNDLKHMKCSQCSELLNTDMIAELIEFIYPMCLRCKKRKQYTSIMKQPCCSEKFCFLCIAENPSKKCFCGGDQEHLEYFASVKNKIDNLFNDFTNLELSCKNLI